MTPAVIDLVIYQGATFRKSFIWQTGDPPAAVNLTGATARMQIRRKASSPTADITLNTENGGIEITSPLTGEFLINITPEMSTPVTITAGVYDLEIVQGAYVTRILMGAITISPEVTK